MKENVFEGICVSKPSIRPEKCFRMAQNKPNYGLSEKFQLILLGKHQALFNLTKLTN